MQVFDQIRAGVLSDRSQFWRDLSMPFYGYTGRGPRSLKGCVNRSGFRE